MNNGMLYKRHSFTVPASETRETDVCEIEGAHIPSGPAKRRNCLRCGLRICGARIRTRECTEAPGHSGDHRQGLSPTEAMGWPQSQTDDVREILDAVSTPADMGGDILGLLTQRELSERTKKKWFDDVREDQIIPNSGKENG